METNAAVVDVIYDSVPVYQEHFVGKIIVIVLDNDAAHKQTEDLVQENDDLEQLRLGHNSFICNPIEDRLRFYIIQNIKSFFWHMDFARTTLVNYSIQIYDSRYQKEAKCLL
ncbi:hypothetical protein AM587_10001541 [Phytophthora nicotianae]|uniref:Tc1-like transposase DDE domain-containing protein n=1 Tax=Phytophthora nicotianae TaxID=4792 RepID=A0A0W8C256_PHYNI|nr:hypothetical protein AM587_10001541 [Phytophthora nicotianae]